MNEVSILDLIGFISVSVRRVHNSVLAGLIQHLRLWLGPPISGWGPSQSWLREVRPSS